MLWTLFPSLLLCAPSPSAWAQFNTVDEAWVRALANPAALSMDPIEVEAAPDGGVLAVGFATGPLYAILLSKLDENGDLLWSDAIDSPLHANSLFFQGRFADATMDAQGNAYVVVSRPAASVVRRYSVDGVLQWEATLPLNGLPGTGDWEEYNAAYIDVAPSGDVIVGGLVRQGLYPRVDVRAFAPDGGLLWEWRGNGASNIASTAQGFLEGLSIGPDGIIYAYGRSDQPTCCQHAPRVIALSPGGALLWRRTLTGSQTPVLAVEFDSQGRPVVVAGKQETVAPWIRVAKYDPDGTEVFLTQLTSWSPRFTATSVAVDAFDRITVGGSRGPDQDAPRTPTLLRFGADGAYLGFVTPSLAEPGEDGYLAALAVTARNDVVALGVSGARPDEVILTRFAPDGTERWAERRRGKRPSGSGSGSVGLGFAADPRGNLFTLVRRAEGLPIPTSHVVKDVQNGPAGAPYCGPAPSNSTGASATIRGLGPSLLNANNVTLRADDLPPAALTLFLSSRSQGLVANVGGGQGTLCLGGSVGRFLGPGQVRVAGIAGTAALQLHLDNLPQPTGIVAASIGETWNFQAWYRDANPSPTSNLTDGIAVLIQ